MKKESTSLRPGLTNEDSKSRQKKNPLAGLTYIDYTNTKLLTKFITETGKILPARVTGVTAKQQRALVGAIKYARHLALMPFVGYDDK